jgi:predicted dehydrogenase
MIGYRIQYEPMNRRMQRLVREKTFGAIKYIESVNGQVLGDPGQWRLSRALSGSGALGDLGVYCMNTIRFLLGEEPTEIFGQAIRPVSDPRFQTVDETVIWQMKFPSAVVANCACSFNFHDLKNYRVCAELANFGMEPAFSYNGLRMVLNRAESEIEHHDMPTIEAKNQFTLELDHMADCVLNNRKPYTPGEEGLQDQRIIEAIFESAKNGQIVKMPSPPGGTLDAFRGPPPG